MALILSIDTAVDTAGICLMKDNQTLGFFENERQKDHASWIHTAIGQALTEAGVDFSALGAIAVTAGPGSYTGLRVGMATAKGLCYALNIPLIMESTLKVMAFAVKEEDRPDAGASLPVVYCPMIDARRMEVFTAVYNHDLEEIAQPGAKILDPTSFESFLSGYRIVFCGNGSIKWKEIAAHDKYVYSPIRHTAVHLAALAAKKWQSQTFTELAYAEPVYLKNFYSPGESN